MPTDSDTELKIERVHCNGCLRQTKHIVIAERHQHQSEIATYQVIDGEDIPIQVELSTTYTLLECCGCEAVTLRCVEWFSEGDGPTTRFFPPQVSRQQPDWFGEHLSWEQMGLLTEIYTALHHDSLRLALMGTRTLIDMFMNDKVGDTGGFAQKLEALVKAGYLSSRDRDVLNAALEAGHAASHRGYRPGRKMVSQVLDIVENLLQSDYFEDVKEHLKRLTPARSTVKSREKTTPPASE